MQLPRMLLLSQTVGRAWPLILILASLGCRGQAYPGPPRGAVHGKVILDGETIGHGSITFLPAAPGGTVSGGSIVQGEYQFTEEFGPTLGEQTVQFYWQKPTGQKITDPESGEQVDETSEGMPEKYQKLSQEKVTVKSGQNEFNFELKSK